MRSSTFWKGTERPRPSSTPLLKVKGLEPANRFQKRRGCKCRSIRSLRPHGEDGFLHGEKAAFLLRKGCHRVCAAVESSSWPDCGTDAVSTWELFLSHQATRENPTVCSARGHRRWLGSSAVYWLNQESEREKQCLPRMRDCRAHGTRTRRSKITFPQAPARLSSGRLQRVFPHFQRLIRTTFWLGKWPRRSERNTALTAWEGGIASTTPYGLQKRLQLQNEAQARVRAL